MRRVFIDLDGVLADFDGHYKRTFGVRPDKAMTDRDPDFWKRLADHPRFFRDLPILPDALQLWRGVKKLHDYPIILTGLPSSFEHAAEDKVAWVRRWIGKDAPITLCSSKHKARHASPGDVLIDDWEKYRHVWVEAGGVFITHTSAEESLHELRIELLSEPIADLIRDTR